MNHRGGHSLICTLWVLLLGVTLVSQESHATTLTAVQAKHHVGETATVCGVVANATFAARSKGLPTFLNLEKPYPEHIFTALIWGSERSQLGQPENTYKGKRICVTGTIKAYRGVPEIVVTDPGQLREAAVARERWEPRTSSGPSDIQAHKERTK